MTTQETQIAAVICPFINRRGIIRFYYQDTSKKNNDWRGVEPHLIGILRSTRNAVLIAWFIPTPAQLIGGETAGWRQYLLRNISQVGSMNQTFQRTRPGYNPNDPKMSQIICRIP